MAHMKLATARWGEDKVPQRDRRSQRRECQRWLSERSETEGGRRLIRDQRRQRERSETEVGAG